MVTIRGASKRTARGSSSAAARLTRSKTASIPASSTPIPAETSETLPNPVNLVPNPANLVPNPAYLPNPVNLLPNPANLAQNESFNFDGVQYSPYFLSTSDNPGISLITETLDGNNYNTWSISMVVALDSKNKLAFIDGSLPRPLETHPYYRIWSRCNSMVKSWILNTVSKEIYGSILRFNDASEIWRDLKVRFHITNLPRSYQLTQQIWSLQQGSSGLSAYYTKLKTLWDNLDGADCVKTCQNCECCRATATKAEHSKMIKFLAGLNESYASVRSQIIMKQPVPSLAEVYNLLDQDFSQRNITPVQNASVFNVAAPDTTPVSINATYNASKSTTRPICSHCGYNGHTVDKCYKIHGYPPGFKHKTKTVAPGKPVVAQLALTGPQITEITDTPLNTLSQDQIQGVIAYFNSQLALIPY